MLHLPPRVPAESWRVTWLGGQSQASLNQDLSELRLLLWLLLWLLRAAPYPDLMVDATFRTAPPWQLQPDTIRMRIIQLDF